MHESTRIGTRIYTNVLLLACLCLFVFLFVSIRVVYAQTAPSFAVYPEKFELALSRGEVRQEEIRITNLSAAALPLHLRAVRWEARDEVGGINFLDTPEDISFDIAQWLAVSSSDFIMEPQETRKLQVTLSVPKNAEPGGKYGAVFVEPTLPEFYFEPGAAKILPRVGILFLIDIPVAGLEGEPRITGASVEELGVEGRSLVLSQIASRITSFFSAPSTAFAAEPAVSVDVLSRTPSSFVLRVRNDGITHIRPSGKITIHNTFGATVAQALLAPTTILPHKVRIFPIAFSAGNIPVLPKFIEQQLAFGRYTATVVLTSEGAEPLVKKLAYWIFPWQGLLVFLLVAGPFLCVVWRFRKRVTTAVLVLLEGGKAALKRGERK